jgi:DNA-binding GntR family transcriptional regulator
VQEHEAILNALRRRDGVGLSHILRTHMRHKREEVMRAGFAEIGELHLETLLDERAV